MKYKILAIIAFNLLYFNSIAQRKIVYKFDTCVNDSLQRGIEKFSRLLNKSERALKMYALVIEDSGEFEVFLQEYSLLPKSGLLTLIRTTNRKLKLKNTFIPIIITADIHSTMVKGDKIAMIPFTGYYIKVISENYQQKVVSTSMLY